MLGRGWFAGRIWTFDYRRKELLHHASAEGLSFDSAHTVARGFKTNAAGERVQHFPSVEATIGGKTHPYWRVIENADRMGGGALMIEVPEVTLAGHTVGPVQFVRQPDREFTEREESPITLSTYAPYGDG